MIQAATSAVTTVLHGGTGAVTDTLTVSGNADMRLTNSEVRLTGAISQRLAIAGFESGGLSGGDDNNVLNAADFSGPVKLQGFGGQGQLHIPVNVTADSGIVTGIAANVTGGRCCAI